jgi:mannonate dehydratase
MQETWRWFGPGDPVTLSMASQAGASGIVTSLHELPTGALWPLDAILVRKKQIENAGLKWAVVESIPLHAEIKSQSGDFRSYIENYKSSIRNVGQAGIRTVCYNFMPVVDWTRTDLDFSLANDSRALRFEMADFAAYDIHVLERPNAAHDYSEEVASLARDRYARMSPDYQRRLERNIIAGLPGGEGSYSRESARENIANFVALGSDRYREHLISFLREIIPVAEESGVRMCIHPDDPPIPLFGLPRVVSTESDARVLLDSVPSEANGLTLCAGSFGARGDNDLIRMAREFGPKIHFVHLRNVKREADGSFTETQHLDGDNDMVGLISALLDEEDRRRRGGREDAAIPMRPDHGHALGEEIRDENVKPGYSFAGRLKGLAELRGVIRTLEYLRAAGARDPGED